MGGELFCLSDEPSLLLMQGWDGSPPAHHHPTYKLTKKNTIGRFNQILNQKTKDFFFNFFNSAHSWVICNMSESANGQECNL